MTNKTTTFTRPPVEAGTTYKDAAELVRKYPEHAEKIIKQLLHYQKAEVYSKFLIYDADWVVIKVDTHLNLYKQLNKELREVFGDDS